MRTGLRIRGQRSHPEVRVAVIRFAKWLRVEFDFPIRVPVYLLPGEDFLTIEGERCVASFFAPWDRTEEPYIRLATGDYPKLKKERGRDDALASILDSLARQIVRYQHWVHTGKITNRSVVAKADRILDNYAQTIDRP
jgi:hypothetical protein